MMESGKAEEALDGFTIVRRNGDIYAVAVDPGDLEAVEKAGPWHVCLNHGKKPYAQQNVRCEDGRWTWQSLHAFLLNLHGIAHPFEVDHRNGRTLDNRLSNLRAVTCLQNQQNRQLYCNNNSGVTGVYWYRWNQKWCARIGVNGRLIFLGYFANKLDAIAARATAEDRYHPVKVVNRSPRGMT